MVNQMLGVLGVFASRKGGCSVHKMIACRAIIWFLYEHWWWVCLLCGVQVKSSCWRIISYVNLLFVLVWFLCMHTLFTLFWNKVWSSHNFPLSAVISFCIQPLYFWQALSWRQCGMVFVYHLGVLGHSWIQ